MKDLPENKPMVNIHGDDHKIQGSGQGNKFQVLITDISKLSQDQRWLALAEQ